jgi:hypothetical protein
MNNKLKLHKKLSNHKTEDGEIHFGNGLTKGSEVYNMANAALMSGGKFTVLWYENKILKKAKSIRRYTRRMKHLYCSGSVAGNQNRSTPMQDNSDPG